jgi:hypothetical protein
MLGVPLMNKTTAQTEGQQQRRGGGPSCTVCHHERRDEFDRALVSDSMSQSEVARAIGCHPSIVSRHRKNHILPALERQIHADPVLGDVDLVAELRALFVRMKRHLDRAEEADNWQAIRAFHAEARNDLETLAKLTGNIRDTSTVNVAVGFGSDWPMVRVMVLRALMPYPDARQAVLDALGMAEGS